jgi:hypothetical protein
MTEMWAYLVIHWGYIVSGSTVAGGVVGYIVGLWKSKTEIALIRSQKEKVDWDLAQAKLDVETKSVAQMVLIITDARKRHAGTQNLAFSLEELWGEIGEPYALRLHAALSQLVTDKRAKKDASGDWLIDPV